MSAPALPALRFVPAASLVLHEDADPRRVEKLVERLRAEAILRNPPIVASMGDARYVVLDGANRVSALRALAVAHPVVQVVDYDQVELSTWNHLVTGLNWTAFFDALRAVPGVRLTPTTLLTARETLVRRRCLAFVVSPSDEVFTLDNGSSFEDSARLLLGISNIYRGDGAIHRIRLDSVRTLSGMYDRITAILVYPRFTHQDILDLARADARVPTGITRHIIPGRVLRLNLPLTGLADPRPLAEKNAWLDALVRDKFANHSVRFYAESTYSFDE
ncbi:MAG: hypothetical protein KIS91_06535 [Anaerolineae bacterium]|nr:hypothetical protein [Anaerolineae bacterium]